MAKLSPSERVRALEERLGVSLERHELVLEALTHRSYANEKQDEGPSRRDNERLEFLGDAVLDLAISHRLIERFPSMKEGELSRLRARIVKNEQGLSRVARQLQLGDLLLLGKGEILSGGRDKSSLLADALEAVFAAVYLSSGMESVLALVDRHFADALKGLEEALPWVDHKTQLQALIQERLKLPPRYRIVSESGPEQEKTFEAEVLIGEVAYARATGRSKKEAEQGAARLALERLAREAEQAASLALPQEATGQGSEADTPAGNPLAPTKAGE